MFLGTFMTTSEALVGLPNGDVTRTRSLARLVPSQRWRKSSILGINGVPAKPSVGEDDCVLKSFHNPYLMLNAEALALLDDDTQEPTDLHARLEVGRTLPSLRITQQDLLKYGYSSDCPRCTYTQLGDASSNPKHTDECRRRVYTCMYAADDYQLTRWLRQHPTDQATVGKSLDLQGPSFPASSSTSPAPVPPSATAQAPAKPQGKL